MEKHKIDLQNTIVNLRNSCESETLKVDKKQITTTVSFLKSVVEKEKTLKVLEHAKENIEKEFKNV